MNDPKKSGRKGGTGPRHTASDIMADPAVVYAISLELTPLSGLSWQPLQMRMESLVDALRGGTGFSQGELQQLRLWAQRWSALPPTLKTFYSEVATTRPGEAAIWRVLEGGSLTGPLRGELERLWLEAFGYPPNIQLFPNKKQEYPPCVR